MRIRFSVSRLPGIITVALLLGLAAAPVQAGLSTHQAPAQEPSVPPPPTATELGDTAFAEQDFATAIATYTTVSPIELDPVSQSRLATAYLMTGREREAEGTLRLAIGRHPELAPALNSMGALLYARGAFDDAEDRFREALEFDPLNPNLQDNLHAARWARENRNAARGQAALLVAANPVLVQRIVEDIVRVDTLQGPDLVAELDDLELRGDVFLARKMFEDAAIEYERLVEIDPYNPMIRNKLGLSYLQLQQMREAERQYKEALDLNPYFLPALNNLGSLEQARSQFQRALNYYRDALELKQDWTIVLQNIGALFFAVERYQEGLQMYIQAIRIDPTILDAGDGSGLPTLAAATRGNEAMTNFYMAKVFAATGDVDRTMSFLYRAVEEGFDDASLLADPDFEILAADDRFVQLVASIRS